uniref:Uncharacterized protein n=1 Tax=Arundo donax TaxID=35708 RepID=A0A0A9ESM4_ARUDO
MPRRTPWSPSASGPSVLERSTRGTRWRGTRMVTTRCATSTIPASPMLSIKFLALLLRLAMYMMLLLSML